MFNYDKYESWKATELKEAARLITPRLYPVLFSADKVTREVNEALSVLGYLIDKVEKTSVFTNSVEYTRYRVFLDSLLVVIKSLNDHNYTMNMTKIIDEAIIMTENIFGKF